MMNTYYVVESNEKVTESVLEYLNQGDKIFFFTGQISKHGLLKKWTDDKYLKNIISVNITPNKTDEILDFKVVPFITELCYNHRDVNIVLVSNNIKLKCLKKYFRDSLNFNIEIVLSTGETFRSRV